MFNRYDEFKTRENSWLHTSDYQFEHEMHDHSKEELFAQLAQLNRQKLESTQKQNDKSEDIALADFIARGRIKTFGHFLTVAKFTALDSLCHLYDKLS